MSDSLINLRGKYPQLGSHLDSLGTLASQKHFHQLTSVIIAFLDSAPTIVPPVELVDFYNGFVSKIANRMNPTQLVRIIGKCTSDASVPPTTCVGMLEQHASHIAASKDAVILSRILRAQQYLAKQKDLVTTRTEVDQMRELMNDPLWSHTVSNSVRGSFHLVAADMYLAMGSNDLDFYENLVKFLTYTPLAEIPTDVITRTTKQAGVIALINPDINDFGDLLSLQAFNESSSPSTPQWVIDLLRAIHLGDFKRFDAAIATHSAYLQSNESQLMSQIESSLKRKLRMIALAELAAFKTPEKNRRLRFADIASECLVAADQVETLIMSTMSTGLIQGVIDEVDESVIVTSVKPRMLDRDRLFLLKSRIENWANRASELLSQMKEVSPELLVR
jgi:26S proteasome regulatory subunit N9